MSRLAALLIGVATAQPQNYYGNADPHVDAAYTTKEGDVYKCDHVAKKPEKRCGRVGNDGVVASEACPKTCGTC